MTRGEYLVGINFNPSNDDMVGMIKRSAADLIDLIDDIPILGGEDEALRSIQVSRLKSLAQTHVENAAMWAVKAATKPHMEE